MLLFLFLLLLFLLGSLVAGAFVALLGVNGFADLKGRVLQALKGLANALGILGDDSLVEAGDVTLDLVLDVLRDLSRVLLKLLLSIVDVLVSLVLKIDDLFGGFILLFGGLSFLNHAVDVGVRKTTAGTDGDLLRLAGGLVLGGDIHDTVGIDIEGDLDLRNTTRSHRDTSKVEVAKLLVILSEFTLTLKNGDSDLGLVVSGGRENLALLGRNGRVSMDQPCEDSAHGLNTKGEGSNVEKQDILDVTGKDSTLDSGSDSDGLIWVDTSVGLLAEEVLDSFANLGDTARATDHENLIDPILGQLRVLKAGLEGLECLVDLSLDQTLELGTCHLHIQMLRTSVIESQVRDADRGVSRRR